MLGGPAAWRETTEIEQDEFSSFSSASLLLVFGTF